MQSEHTFYQRNREANHGHIHPRNDWEILAVRKRDPGDRNIQEGREQESKACRAMRRIWMFSFCFVLLCFSGSPHEAKGTRMGDGLSYDH